MNELRYFKITDESAIPDIEQWVADPRNRSTLIRASDGVTSMVIEIEPWRTVPSERDRSLEFERRFAGSVQRSEFPR